jgi:hypothetical protein
MDREKSLVEGERLGLELRLAGRVVKVDRVGIRKQEFHPAQGVVRPRRLLDREGKILA